MENSSLKNRPRKRNIDVVDLDSNDEEQVVKKEPEEIPTVAELQQKLRETEQKLDDKEKDYKKLWKLTGEYMQRAEKAEKIIEENQSKQTALDEVQITKLEKKVIDWKNLANEQKKSIEEANERVTNLTNLLEEQKKQANEREADLKKQLEDQKKKFSEREAKLTDQLKEKEITTSWRESYLSNQLETEKTRNALTENNLASQLEEEKKRASQREKALSEELKDERKEAREFRMRNDELSTRLAKYDVWLQQINVNTMEKLQEQHQEQMLQMQKVQENLASMHQYQNWIAASAATLTAPVEKVAQIYEIGNGFNLFQLIRPGTEYSIPLYSAVAQLKSKLCECGEEKWLDFIKDGVMHGDNDCAVCDKKVKECNVLNHFFSTGHKEKVNARGAAVSNVAFAHWNGMLQVAMDGNYAPADAAAEVASSAAAAAPPSGEAEETMTVEKSTNDGVIVLE